MLRDKDDIDKFNLLCCSLNNWASNTNNNVRYIEYKKETGSLYRYGWFIINGYKYSISGWKLKDGIITFENEISGEKIKYDIINSDVVNKTFIKDSLLISMIKKVRITLSKWLRNISDKLQP